MGLLDDAIRQHLELKRAHGASSEELAEKEAEAFGPVRRERPEPEPGGELAAAEVLEEEPPLVDEPPAFEPVADEPTELLEAQPAEPEAFLEPADEPEPLMEPEPESVPEPEPEPEVEADPADEIFADEPAESAPGEEEEEDEDVLEETPDFLQETPEHDRLWFEQKPPRDFDFDDD